MTTLEALAHDAACRRRPDWMKTAFNLCPVHLMPDCSPLLNGCSRLTAPGT